MKKDPFVKPFVKWVGGKRQLLPAISNKIKKAKRYTTYYEPFVGGGAVLFDLQPSNAVINDSNAELINAYRMIKEKPDSLIARLKKYKNDEDCFYRVRALDRTEEYNLLSDVDRASRLIYLNKTCYNGLYRVNQQGFFNSPFGHYKNPNIVDENGLHHLSTYLNENNIVFKTGDFEDCLENITSGSLVYFDPPYDPMTTTSNFTGYTSNGFTAQDQKRLARLCARLDKKGVKFILSNSKTPLILDLYEQFEISTVFAKRSVNSNALKRGDVEEVLITNF